MKRKLLFYLSTLILFLPSFGGFVQTAAAIDTEETYWTYDELQGISTTVLAELTTSCSDISPECRREFFETRGETKPIYNAMERFFYDRFLITAFNPSMSTMRVVYRDRDLSAERMNLDAERLIGVYVVRYDTGYLVGDLPTVVLAGDDAKVHTVYYEQPITEFASVGIPANTEVTLPIAQMEFSPTIRERFDYQINLSGAPYEYYYGIAGVFNFSGCFKTDSGYEDGMECRLAYGSGGETIYVPATAKQTTPISDNSDSSITDSKDSVSIDATPAPDPATFADSSAVISDYSEVAVPAATALAEESISIAEIAIKPSTGTYTELSATSTETSMKTMTEPSVAPLSSAVSVPLGGEAPAKFPWWVLAIILPGLSILAWWFLPLKSKSAKKHQK